MGIYTVLPPKIAESRNDVSTLTNDFIGNFGNSCSLSDLANVVLCTAQARMLSSINQFMCRLVIILQHQLQYR